MEVYCEIRNNFQPLFEDRTGCQIDIRCNWTGQNRYVYCLIANGSKKSIEKAKNILVLTDNDSDTRDTSRPQKTRRLTDIINGIQGICESRVDHLVGLGVDDDLIKRIMDSFQKRSSS